MPIETKKSTAKASLMGRASEAARMLKSDCPTTMPARNAPSAIETPKETTGRSHRQPQSQDQDGQREEALASWSGLRRSGGVESTALREDNQADEHRQLQCGDSHRQKNAPGPGARAAGQGGNTTTKTVKMSSTTSQPTATAAGPALQVANLSASTRTRTTVLATESAMPNAIPAGHVQPKACATTAPSAVARTIWEMAPTTAMLRTATKVLQVEVQPHSEHQEDHPNLGKLLGNFTVGHSPGECGPTSEPATR